MKEPSDQEWRMVKFEIRAFASWGHAKLQQHGFTLNLPSAFFAFLCG